MSFDVIQRFVAKWEGGYSDHPNDPGGPTNYGICLRYLKEQGVEIGDLDGDGDIDAMDIRAMTPRQAAYIMKREWWDKDVSILDYDHPRCAMVVYDTSINMGKNYGKKLMQKALGVSEDGIWGPITWKAIQKCRDYTTAKLMCEIRKDRYAYLAERNPKLAVFLDGWNNRVDDLMRLIRR